MRLFAAFDDYRRSFVRGDVVAGLTVWAVLIPESLAYATIAGVSPVVGLYAAIPALLLYPVFGSSRHLVVGPMSATAALSAGVVGGFATAGTGDFAAYTAGLAIAVGVMAIIAGVLRLGFLSNFISEPVLKGFIVGMALVIIIGQVPKLIGIEGSEGNFFARLWAILTSLGDANTWTVAVGISAVALIVLLRRGAPMVPGSLVAVAGGILAVSLFALADRGVAIVGEVEAGLPSPGVPDLATADIPLLLSGAVGVMLVGFAEGLGAAKTYAQKHGYRIDANRELLGLGSINLGSGFFSGMVVNGSLSKTAVNGGAGARSQLSGYVVALLTVVTLLFLTGLFEQLPDAVLAAVVITAVIELVDVDALRRLYRVSSARLESIYGRAARADFIGALAAMLGVLIFDTLPGLIIGVVLSVLLLLYRASRPHIATLGRVPGGRGQWVDIERHPDSETTPGVVVIRVESGMFFANADAVADHLRSAVTSAATVHAVVLDALTTPMIDTTAANMLRDLTTEFETSGVRLCLVGDIGQVRDVLRATGAGGVLDRVYPSIDDAVDASRGDTTAIRPDS